MLNKDIKTLKREIKKKELSQKSKKLEIEDIEEREKLIKEYEDADIKSRHNLIKFLVTVGVPIVVTLVLLIARKISFFEAFNYIFLGEAITYFSWSESLTKYQEANESFKKISRKEYKRIKQNQQKDKALKLSLLKECTQIDQDILDLKAQIVNIKSQEYNEKVEKLRNVVSFFLPKRHNLNNTKDENKSYESDEQSLESTELDNAQTLTKSFDSRKVG